LVVCVALFAFRFHANVIARPYLITDDTLQHLAFFEPVGGRSFHDVAPQAGYLLDLLPVGVKAFYKAGLFLGLDTVLLSKLLTAKLFCLALALAFLLGRRIAGNTGGLAFFTALLIFDGVFTQFAGGVARAFGYPVVLLAVYGVFTRSTPTLAVSLIASALFYPPMVLFTGAAFACAVVLPRVLGDEGRATRRTVLTGGIVVAISILLALPGVLAGRSWGPALTRAELEALPEAGSHGRYQRISALPLPSFVATVEMTIDSVFRVSTTVPKPLKSPPLSRLHWLFAALAILPAFAARRQFLRPLLAVWILALACVGLATLTFPLFFYPSRTVLFVLPVVFLSGLAVVLSRVMELVTARWARAVLAGVLCLAGIVFAPPFKRGYNVELERYEGLYRTVRALPPEAVVAGLPSRALDAVPLFAARPFLASIETYNLFHWRYLRAVRERMADSLAMTFPATREQLHALSEKTGAHFVLLPASVERQGCPAFRLFTPYAAMAAELCNAADPGVTAALPTLWEDREWRLVALQE
jgi:hypothetical protein